MIHPIEKVSEKVKLHTKNKIVQLLTLYTEHTEQ